MFSPRAGLLAGALSFASITDSSVRHLFAVKNRRKKAI
jgi:hypothetical protein